MLLLDLGNSAIKAQYWQAGALSSSVRILIGSGWRSRFDHYLSTVDTEQCAYTAVPGSPANQVIQNCLTDKFEQTIKMSVQDRIDGVVCAYPQPQRLGVDRWLALLGARQITSRDAIVIDAGSAITVDLLRHDGQHLGGAILPGFNTALARFKTILSVANFEHDAINDIENPGCSTESCIHINYTPETDDYLRQLIDRWFGMLPDDAVLIVAGGDASRVTKHPKHEYRLIPDLVFLGMRRQLESDG